MPSSRSVNLKKARFKILEESHNVNGFCCGVKEIDDFICKEAMGFQNERLGVTYLLHLKDKILGFVTLSMADLRKERMESEDRLQIGKENYPALQIGQLAVCEKLQREGIGTYLCDFCLAKAYKFSEEVGCRFLVLNARREIISFYEEYGFKLLPRQESRREPVMFLNIHSKKKIEDMIKQEDKREKGGWFRHIWKK